MLEFSEPSDGQNRLELGLSQWKVQALTALKVGAAELRSMFLKVMQLETNLCLIPALLWNTQRYHNSIYRFLLLSGWWHPYSGKDLSTCKTQQSY